MIAVWTTSGPYAAAAAELPLELTRTESPAGAVAVIACGRMWGAAALRAIGDGARAVVVADPVALPPDELDALAATPVPVVLDRAMLRADVAGDALGALDGRTPALVVAECGAVAARDAVGWLRSLLGAAPAVRASTSTPAGIIAHLDVRGVLATLTVAARSAAPAGARLRLTAVADPRVEIVVREGAHASVDVSSAAGTMRLPTRFETRRRLALRRALAAVEGRAVDDLAVFRDDVRVAEALHGR